MRGPRTPFSPERTVVPPPPYTNPEEEESLAGALERQDATIFIIDRQRLALGGGVDYGVVHINYVVTLTANQSGLVTLSFDLLTLKVVSHSRVTWATSVPILVFLGLSVLELRPKYATDRQTDVRCQTNASLNAPAY